MSLLVHAVSTHHAWRLLELPATITTRELHDALAISFSLTHTNNPHLTAGNRIIPLTHTPTRTAVRAHHRIHWNPHPNVDITVTIGGWNTADPDLTTPQLLDGRRSLTDTTGTLVNPAPGVTAPPLGTEWSVDRVTATLRAAWTTTRNAA